MSFLIAVRCFFLFILLHTFCLMSIRTALYHSFFCIKFTKNIFCFLSYSPQRQIKSFRISGVHGTLLSQIIPLQYITFSLGCQVEFVLILFYYFLQTLYHHFSCALLHTPHQHFIQKHQRPVGIVLDVSPTFLWDTNVKLTFYLT